MSNLLRQLVSKKRNRLVDGKFNLDLTYINEKIIAMGYPSDKPIENLIRNNIKQVSEYLNEKHENSYKIFNLCLESDYDFSYFNNMVIKIEIEDHNPPRFDQILQFCSEMDLWLNNDKENIAVVHCRAGKGRTGTMICIYLLHLKLFNSPFDAINEFSQIRFKNSDGVTIPSQKRYIEYYYYYLKNNCIYKQTLFKLNSLIVINVNNYYSTSLIHLQIDNGVNKGETTNSLISNKCSITNNFNFETIINNESIILFDDLKFSFLSKKKHLLFSCTINTFFVNSMISNENNLSNTTGLVTKMSNDLIEFKLVKKEIDILCKNKKVSDDFQIIFQFELIHANSNDLMANNKEQLTNKLITNKTKFKFSKKHKRSLSNAKLSIEEE